MFHFLLSKTRHFQAGTYFALITLIMLICSTSLSAQPPYFEKITSGELVEVMQRSYSASWADVNNNGYDDLLILDLEVNMPNMLYMNNGDGTFTANPNSGITAHIGPSIAANWGDYDNDGYLDVYISNTGNDGDDISKNFLFKNNGDGSFTRITEGAIVNDTGWSLGSGWADFNKSGYIDLYVANFNGPNKLYINNGDGSFTSQTTGDLVTDNATSYGAYWVDVNNNGWPDLFVVNAFGTSLPPDNNCLYMNNGDGSFTKVTEGHIVNNLGISHGASWGDYTNNGFQDLFVTNHDWSDNKSNFLYQNNGDGTFTYQEGINVTTDQNTSFGSAWLDVNNNGHLDLIVSNNKTSNRHNYFYINNGDGSFTSVTDDPVQTDLLRSFGVTVSDFDNDGHMDVFIATYSPSQANGFYRNLGGQGNYLAMKLEGSVSNRAAIGARIHLWAGGLMQTREVFSASGQYASSSFVQHFGLAGNMVADSIHIHWPSGNVNRFYEIEANQRLHIIEEEEELSDEADIVSLVISGQLGESLINTEEANVYVLMPHGTDLSSLSPVIEISEGAQIDPASGEAVDFSQGAVIYLVTAENSEVSREWTVMVENEASDQALILSFFIEQQIGDTTIDADNQLIEVVMPEGTSLEGLMPVIEISEGAQVNPASGEAVDFSQGVVEYTVTAEDQQTSLVWIVQVSFNTGISETGKKTELLVYPNPSDGNSIVQVPNSEKALHVKIYNTAGVLIYHKPVDSQTTGHLSLNLNGQTPGVYIIEIQTENSSHRGRLMIR